MSRNRQRTASKGHESARTYRMEKVFSAPQVAAIRPTYLMLHKSRKRMPHLAIRNVKIYCERKHEGLSFKEIAKKHFMKEGTADNAFYKIKERIERWRNESD